MPSAEQLIPDDRPSLLHLPPQFIDGNTVDAGGTLVAQNAMRLVRPFAGVRTRLLRPRLTSDAHPAPLDEP